MKLGGNIELEGFDSIEPAQLVVVKKIVGSNAKKISEEISAFESLSVVLKGTGQERFVLIGKISIKGSENTAEVTENNLFFALNSLFLQLKSNLK